MKNVWGIIGIVITVAIVLYIASVQLKTITPGGGTVAADPKSTVNLQGVRADLSQFSKVEQQHLAMDGHYATLSDLHSDTGIPADSRGPYSYDIEVTTDSFKVTATYQGTPPPGVPKTLSIGPTGSITQE